MAHYLLSGMIVFAAGGFTFGGVSAKSDRMVATSFIAAIVVMTVFALTHQHSGYQYLVFDPICYVVGIIFGAAVTDDEPDTSDSPYRR